MTDINETPQNAASLPTISAKRRMVRQNQERRNRYVRGSGTTGTKTRAARKGEKIRGLTHTPCIIAGLF